PRQCSSIPPVRVALRLHHTNPYFSHKTSTQRETEPDLFVRSIGSANGTRTRISALRGPRANLCTIAPKWPRSFREVPLGKACCWLLYRGAHACRQRLAGER